MALLAILGAAFAIGKPKASTWLFGSGAAIGLVAGATAEIFTDLLIWGVILIGPSVAAFLGRKEIK